MLPEMTPANTSFQTMCGGGEGSRLLTLWLLPQFSRQSPTSAFHFSTFTTVCAEAGSTKNKTCHKEKEPEMPDLQAILPQNLPVVTIRHQNPLYTSVIVGKQTLKNDYFSEPRAFDVEFVLQLKYINF